MHAVGAILVNEKTGGYLCNDNGILNCPAWALQIAYKCISRCPAWSSMPFAGKDTEGKWTCFETNPKDTNTQQSCSYSEIITETPGSPGQFTCVPDPISQAGGNLGPSACSDGVAKDSLTGALICKEHSWNCPSDTV